MEWESNVKVTDHEQPRFLVLFDIDWTLVVTGGLVLRGMTTAYKEFFGIKAKMLTNDIGIGRTDPWMLREIGRTNGIDDARIQEKFDKMLEFTSNYYVENASKDGGSIMPGVPDLLKKVDEKGYMRALVTGNLEMTAYHKLKRFGLEKGFAFGAFGSDAEDRAVLLQVALQKAKDRYNFAYNGHNALYIADSIHDVAAAKQAGIPAVIKLHKISENAPFGDPKPLAFLKGTEYHDEFFKLIDSIQRS